MNENDYFSICQILLLFFPFKQFVGSFSELFIMVLNFAIYN